MSEYQPRRHTRRASEWREPRQDWPGIWLAARRARFFLLLLSSIAGSFPRFNSPDLEIVYRIAPISRLSSNGIWPPLGAGMRKQQKRVPFFFFFFAERPASLMEMRLGARRAVYLGWKSTVLTNTFVPWLLTLGELADSSTRLRLVDLRWVYGVMCRIEASSTGACI